MYLAFYGLKKEPFHTTPDPNFLYLSPTHKEALGAIIYGIEQRKGFIAITGEVGVGKTTIIRAYLERPATRKQKTIYIFNPVVSFQALLSTIFRSLEVEPKHHDQPEMVNQLHEILIEEYRSNSTVVLVIDEAQNMPVETLENLRMLSNLETVADKLIQIVLIGQPELNTLLDDPKLKALKQRIALRSTICPLTPKESQAYIEHRVNLASHTGHPLFTSDAMKLLAQKSQGIPRRLNILCDNALITGYGRQKNPATVSEVREILADLDSKGPSLLSRWQFLAAAALLLALASFFIVFSFSANQQVPSEPTINSHESRPIEENSLKNDTEIRKLSQNQPGSTSDHIEGHLEFNKENQPIPRQAKNQSPNNTTALASPLPDSENTETLNNPTSPSSSTHINSENSDSDSLKLANKSAEKSIVLPSGPQTSIQTIASPPDQGDPEFQVPSDNGPTKTFPRTRLVKKGENLSRITTEIYGSNDPAYVNWVREHNSEITNPDFILPGQQIILPEYVKE